MKQRKPTQPKPDSGALIGYARVSTDDQDCAAQVWELRNAGCTEIIQEYGSGANQQRPALARLLGSIAGGDTLVVVRLDRLARSLTHLIQLLDTLTTRGAGLRSLRDPIDTGSPAGRFSLHILGAAAAAARDPATTQQLAEHRKARALERAQHVLGPWLLQIKAQRPAAWEIIASRIADAGGPDWSGERLRRTMHKLATTGLHGE